MLSLNDLVLRSMNETDLDTVLSWRNSDEIRRHMLSDAIINRKDHLEWFKKNSDSATAELFVAEYKNSPIGVVTITEINSKNKTCTWGMYIGGSDQNLGVGILMNIKVIDQIVDIHNVRKIWGHVLGKNSVIQIHEKFGFQREGLLKKHIERNGICEDVTLLALFTENWPKSRQDVIDAFKIKE